MNKRTVIIKMAEFVSKAGLKHEDDYETIKCHKNLRTSLHKKIPVNNV